MRFVQQGCQAIRTAIPQVMLAISLVGPLGISDSARADLVLEFDRPNYSVSPGQVINVQVFLIETPGTSVLTVDGLFGAGVDVNYNVAPFASDPAQVTGIAPPDGLDPTANVITSNTPATGLSVGIATLIWDNGLGPIIFPPSGSNEVLIGTFQFTAGSTPGQVTNLALDIPTGLGNQFLSGTGNVLDSLITPGTATVAVTAVPEPNSFVLLGFGAIGLFLRSWRRPDMRAT